MLKHVLAETFAFFSAKTKVNYSSASSNLISLEIKNGNRLIRTFNVYMLIIVSQHKSLVQDSPSFGFAETSAACWSSPINILLGNRGVGIWCVNFRIGCVIHKLAPFDSKVSIVYKNVKKQGSKIDPCWTPKVTPVLQMRDARFLLFFVYVPLALHLITTSETFELKKAEDSVEHVLHSKSTFNVWNFFWLFCCPHIVTLNCYIIIFFTLFLHDNRERNHNNRQLLKLNYYILFCILLIRTLGGFEVECAILYLQIP